MDLEHIRREYLLGGLRRRHLCPSPFDQFQLWLQQALKSNISDATAMTVATVNKKGMPSQRIVLLKQTSEQGFVFFTHYESRKAQEVEGNSQASLHFPWHMMERQVSIEGRLEKVDSQVSKDYFYSRPKDSQIAASVSPQSRVIESRQVLEKDYQDKAMQCRHRELAFPDDWGGYCLVPNYFEFWQGGEHRLHDRFRYYLSADQWHIDRLAP